MNKLKVFAAGFLALVMVISMAPAQLSATQSNTSSSPMLMGAMAQNTGGTSAKEAGDSVVLKFSKSTDKPAIDASNIASFLSLDNSHSFLDGAGALGSADWSEDGKRLTIVLSAGTSLPTVQIGDKVTVLGSGIEDLDGNDFTGHALIRGSFTATANDGCTSPVPTVTPTPSPTVSTSISGNNSSSDHDDDDDDCDRDEHRKFRCGTGLQNGRLYKLSSSPTVYLLAACRFKPFRGAAAFHSRGHKFQDIIVLNAFPAGMTVSDEPVVPAEGALIKGSDKTVWFVGKNGKRRGFANADIFLKLGFKFDKVDQISDSDLSTVAVDTPINTDTEHPDGALVKCTVSPAVFVVIGRMRFAFANAEAFQSRGHRFDHILVVDCSRFQYKEGAPIS